MLEIYKESITKDSIKVRNSCTLKKIQIKKDSQNILLIPSWIKKSYHGGTMGIKRLLFTQTH